MSKKKNTLQDLDEFLKQQAATLVSPTPLKDALQETISAPDGSPSEITDGNILAQLKELSSKDPANFRSKLYDLIINTLESQHDSSAEDKMLINTALYLKSGSSWKETIKKYWENHP